jgi:hypothetical protein
MMTVVRLRVGKRNDDQKVRINKSKSNIDALAGYTREYVQNVKKLDCTNTLVILVRAGKR